MSNYNPDTNHIDNPLQTKLQEVIFDLYDNKQTNLAKKLEEIEVKMFKVKEKEDEIIAKNYREYLSRYGWKEMSTSNGNAWFGGKTHTTLADYFPEEALKYNLEDIDFVVCGWQYSGDPNEEETEDD